MLVWNPWKTVDSEFVLRGNPRHTHRWQVISLGKKVVPLNNGTYLHSLIVQYLTNSILTLIFTQNTATSNSILRCCSCGVSATYPAWHNTEKLCDFPAVNICRKTIKKPNLWNSGPASGHSTLAMVVLCSGDFKLHSDTISTMPCQLVIKLQAFEWVCV